MRRTVSITFSASMLLTGMVPQVAEMLTAYPYAYPAWFLAAFLAVGLPVMKEAVETAFKGNVFSEFTLMSLASAGAFVIGEYPEGVAVMLFYTIGELFQQRAVGKARADIRALLEKRKTGVDVVTDNGITDTAPEKVPVGSVIEVKAGQNVAIDGILTDGDAYFDTSAMTGESLPRLFRKGEHVLAGMIASERAVRLVTVKAYEDSAVVRMMKMVEEASAHKAPAETFMRRFARIYTPAVTLCAVLLVAVPFVVSRLDASFAFVPSEWIYRAVVFLAVSCPCALVISIPLSYFGGIGAASRYGVLFKGSGSLDAAASVNTVLFDKTGTLTEGIFTVRETVCPQGVDPEKLLSLAAGTEAASTHPVARAVAGYAKERGIGMAAVTDKAEIAGYGMSGRYEDKPLFIGGLRLMKREGIAYPESAEHATGTIVACALDGRFMGYLVLGDTPKKDAEEAVLSLEKLGITDIEIVSGDKQPVVDSLAASLGITGTGDMLPDDKMARIKKLSASGRKVAFVGDGINDAPVMAAADVAVAMGAHGSDITVETADAVIETDEPSKMAVAVRAGRATVRAVRQNIALSLGVKIAVLSLGALGIVSIWGAVFADVGVSLLAVMNALRIVKMKLS